ncbi:MAG: hypothetical protein JXR51_00485 [Bacteroidales bacterium]|nr:hypothetical protein [Bacteroidales bacterium]MBN2755617.1 hypothetical protein [Bacteroidales bacterium]
MKELRNLKLVLLISILCTLSINAFSQFEAKMQFTLSGVKKDFKVFSDKNRYRNEFNEDGQEGIIIVLNQPKKVFVIIPQQKMAIKTNPYSPMSMGNDPLKLYEYQLDLGGTEKIIGNETVNGYDCVKKELYGESKQLLYTMWYSNKYSFPIKIVSHIDVAGDTNMELKDIKSWTADEAGFKIPEGFTIMEQ